MSFTLEKAAEMLKNSDNIMVLSHSFPDGDTLGAASALCRALKVLGKKVMFHCEHKVPQKFEYLFSGIEEVIYEEGCNFEPSFIMAADVADIALIGSLGAVYNGKVDLCIDHHASNKPFAKETYVDSFAAAACEILCEFIGMLGVSVDEKIATSLYTGISTDTGCFRYRNVTPKTMRAAAMLMERDIDASGINYRMFEVKTKTRLELERAILENMKFSSDGKVALISIEQKMIDRVGASEGDLDGISAIARTIEGVLIGITLREKDGGDYKVSLRAVDGVRACDICAQFGGGGHAGAAGCTLSMPLEESERTIMKACEEYISEKNL